MCAQSTNVPPSLQRGLDCLELLAQFPDGLRHSDIQRECHWSKTATTRVLQHLQEMGYIARSPVDHRYRSQSSTQSLAPQGSSSIELLHHGEPILQEMSDATRWSAVLLYWNGSDVVCLAHVLAEHNGCLQRPGHITQRIVDNPYHVFFLSQLQWRRIRFDRKDTLDAGLNHAWYQRELKRLKTDGYTLANNAGRLRIATPVHKGRQCVGALMLGHNNARAGHIKAARILVAAGKRLSAHF